MYEPWSRNRLRHGRRALVMMGMLAVGWALIVGYAGAAGAMPWWMWVAMIGLMGLGWL